MSASGRLPAPDDLPKRVFGELERLPGSGEDLTARILRRLDAEGATRHRRRRWTVVGLAALVLIAAGVMLQSVLTPPRAPAGPTVPAAVRSDFDRHEQTLDRAVRSIRQLAPAFGTPAADSEPAPQQDRPVDPDPSPAQGPDAPERDLGRA